MAAAAPRKVLCFVLVGQRAGDLISGGRPATAGRSLERLRACATSAGPGAAPEGTPETTLEPAFRPRVYQATAIPS